MALPLSLKALIRLVTARVAVPDADNPGISLNTKPDHVLGIGDPTPLGIECPDIYYGGIRAIGKKRGFVHHQDHIYRLAGGFHFFADLPAISPAFCFKCPGFIGNIPVQMAVSGHGFLAQAEAIQKKFHLTGIAVYPNLDLLPLLSRPVPMGADMQDVIPAPPGFIIVGQVFRESAYIQDSEMGVDIRPFKRSGLAAVIESGPDKSAHEPLILRRLWPPGFRKRCPPRSSQVLVRQVTFHGIHRINAPCGHGAAHFGSQNRLTGMIAVVILHCLMPVIKTPYRYNLIDTLEFIPQIGRIGTGSCRVELADPFKHRQSYSPAITVGLHILFLIADRP